MSYSMCSATTDGYADRGVCIPKLGHEDPSEIVAIVSAIPDGMHLANFPAHLEGSECWCRPKVTYLADLLFVDHKDLGLGDFDS